MTEELFKNFTAPTAAEESKKEEAPATTEEVSAEPISVLEGAEDSDEADDVPMPDELTVLKQRATTLGISYPNNITAETLRKKINAKLESDMGELVQESAPVAEKTAPKTPDEDLIVTGSRNAAAPKSGAMSLRKMLMLDAMKLVRLRIVNLDPKDAPLKGQIYTVANEYIGTVTRYIPFGEATDNGTHVENCLYKLLKAQKFLQVRTVKGADGKETIEQNWVRKFSLEVLPQLTDKELAELRAAQRAKRATD